MTSAWRALAAAFLATLVGTISCSLSTESGDFGDLPDRKSFIDNKVSVFMESRCGGLDCHGQDGRPLRLYSQYGLRLRPRDDGSRDNSPTTAEEQVENYRSVVGLEPENLADCFESKGEKIDTFQLLKKPLDISNGGIRHKGGSIMRSTQDDPGWQCLYGWASGTPNPAQCELAAKVQR